MLFTLTSCSTDDDGGDGGNAGAGTMTVKVDGDSEKILNEIVIKDKDPMYEVDDVEGILYFKSKENTINAYKLNK